jgi:hypothetical protein
MTLFSTSKATAKDVDLVKERLIQLVTELRFDGLSLDDALDLVLKTVDDLANRPEATEPPARNSF